MDGTKCSYLRALDLDRHSQNPTPTALYPGYLDGGSGHSRSDSKSLRSDT